MLKINNKKGYTLTEVVLVMVIISILVTGTVVGATIFIKKAKDAGVNTDLKSINVTIDYLKERKSRLPNIAEVKADMGEHGYKFFLSDAIISEVEGETYITIRAETTQLSKYNIPYALNVIAEYSSEFGDKSDGDIIDIEVNEEALLNFNPDKITMIVLDNTYSGVPEIYWLN